LPSSVLSKSAVAKHVVDGSPGLVGIAASMIRNAADSFNAQALPVFVLIMLVVAHPVLRVLRAGEDAPQRWSLGHETVFAGIVAGALIAHVLFGAWGGFVRYGAYAVAVGMAGALVLWHGAIARLIARRSVVLDGAALAALLYTCIVYVLASVETPSFARGTYEQQYQMHRFAMDYYRRPVAVNDLGWVSYRNPNYVLDLWGLGSEAARQARAAGEPGSAWMDRLAKARHVGMAMIYEPWFAGQIPPTWSKLAVFRTPVRLSLGLSEVAFYATSDDAAGPALAALQAFSRHLLSGTSLTIFDKPTAPDKPA